MGIPLRVLIAEDSEAEAHFCSFASCDAGDMTLPTSESIRQMR